MALGQVPDRRELQRRPQPLAAEVIARRAAMLDQFAALVPPGTSLTHAALQYVLAYSAVSTVIPSAKDVTQVRDNCTAGASRLPEAVVQAIYAWWERELKDNPLRW